MKSSSFLLVMVSAAVSAGCSQVIGLDKLSVESGDGGGSSGTAECATNSECRAKATLAGTDEQVVCVKPAGKCVPLLSDDCQTITGDYKSDSAIVIGSLLATTGAAAGTNTQRQQGAVLAIEEINKVGGVQTSTADHPLVMVSCDSNVNLLRAAGHLVSDLKVPAMVGPNASQDTIDVSNRVSSPGGTVVVSPSAIASAIGDLLDNNLTWLMMPTDVQRAPLMINQINSLETKLKTDRSVSSVKLSIIYRNDALGIGTRVGLDGMTINGKPLADVSNAGSGSGNVRIEPYDGAAANQQAIVDRQVAFAPDIVVLAGTAESVTKVMTPLEAAWTASNRPYYLLIDPNKTTELLTAVKNNDNLRLRVRGGGITPGTQYKRVFDAFTIDYNARYGSTGTPGASGVGTSYDATYAIAYALAAAGESGFNGAGVSAGLQRLAGGPTSLMTGSQGILLAFQHLSAGENLAVDGTFGPLAWESNGAIHGGFVEVWCVGSVNGSPAFSSSGLTYDIVNQAFSGSYAQCQ